MTNGITGVEALRYKTQSFICNTKRYTFKFSEIRMQAIERHIIRFSFKALISSDNYMLSQTDLHFKSQTDLCNRHI